jgi:hypothetical protein
MKTTLFFENKDILKNMTKGFEVERSKFICGYEIFAFDLSRVGDLFPTI